jgi:OFA family oxalate/formate antiporter-like MFS transporter
LTNRLDRGTTVTLAGLGVNLCLGVLYAWGVISAALIDQLGWTATQTQLPYMTACACFALSMVPGGRLQDRFGPKPVIIASAALAGLGFVLSALTLTVAGMVLFFGVVFGIGMGLGYAAPTPAAVKWFGPHRRGVISGIVVSGFGLAPIIMAPLKTYLIAAFGLRPAFIITGVAFFGLLILLAQLISNPPPGFVPKPPPPTFRRIIPVARDRDWREVLRSSRFYVLWTLFCFGTFAGLLIIGQLSKIGLEQARITTPFLLVAVYAAFNAAGRVLWGIISDRIGRGRSLFIAFTLQVLTYIAFPHLETPPSLMAGIAVVGFTFGGMLTLFPAFTADYFGLRNLGVNYGLLITAWGVGGVFGPLVGGIVRDTTGTYALSYTVSAALSAAGAFGALLLPRLRDPDAEPAQGPAPEAQRARAAVAS